jgi:hypothetical protein
MLRLFPKILLALAAAGMVNSASAFSLLGPIDTTFQTAAIGYNPLNTDIGGPMALGEGYRWNIRTIYVGFDPSFMHFFGAQGSNAVMQALNILNDLPAMSKLHSDLREFPNDTQRVNYRAETLGIIDLKSYTLAVMMECLGLASPERYTWTLRDRRAIVNSTNFQYLVIQRNFDPVTATSTAYVNDNLWYYVIVDPINIPPTGTYADALELAVDPVQKFTAVATAADSIYARGVPLLTSGTFFTGLTRDDVGGLRYLYNKSFANSYVENLVPDATGAGTGSGSPWGVVGGTNAIQNTALRPGVDKFVFKVAPNTVFGNFIAFTNNNKDSFFPSNSTHLASQTFQRAVVRPDIVFAAGDLGLTTGGDPIVIGRSPVFVNNAGLNTSVGAITAGPGNITGTTVITFNKIGPNLINQGPNFLDQANTVSVGFTWGSYDGSTNDPVVYGTTIQALEQFIFAP